jgi:hypothetical protein
MQLKLLQLTDSIDYAYKYHIAIGISGASRRMNEPLKYTLCGAFSGYDFCEDAPRFAPSLSRGRLGWG